MRFIKLQLQNQKPRLHAFHLLVEPMQSVENKMELVLVHVCLSTLEIHMKVVVQNVLSIQTVLRIEVVFEINVWTCVRESVVSMQNAKLSLTYHCVPAGLHTLAIHSEFVRQFLQNLVFFSFFHSR